MPDPGNPSDHHVEAEDPLTSADPSAADESAADPSVSGESVTFQNRAARRAKKTVAKQQQTQGKAKHLGGRGSVQGPRQWGNRRSG